MFFDPLWAVSGLAHAGLASQLRAVMARPDLTALAASLGWPNVGWRLDRHRGTVPVAIDPKAADPDPHSIGMVPMVPGPQPERDDDEDNDGDGFGNPRTEAADDWGRHPWCPPYLIRPDAPGVAILPIKGPIFRDATLMNCMMVHLFGGTILEWWAQAFGLAASDPRVGGILLEVDSPGGHAKSLTELARRVRAVNDGSGDEPARPVTAYVDGNSASAAYYLTAAAGRIVASPSSLIGCIGTLFYILDDSAKLKNDGYQEIVVVSDDAPNKWVDPATEKGRLQLKEMANGIQASFRMDVARFRGVSELTVMEDFGAGGELIAADARKMGMVDEVGDFEATLKAVAVDAAARLGERDAAAGAGMGGRNGSTSVAMPGGFGMASGTKGADPMSKATGTNPETPAGDADGLAPLAGPVPFRGGPVIEDEPWDGPAADTRVRKWASSDGSGDLDKIDWAKYRQAHVWYDASKPDRIGSHKGIHHDVKDGQLRPHKRGVQVLAGVINGARGGIDIPEGDMPGVKAHVEKHYAQWGEKAPWAREQGSGADAGELTTPGLDADAHADADADIDADSSGFDLEAVAIDPFTPEDFVTAASERRPFLDLGDL